MVLMPKRVKFRKSQRGRRKGKASQGNTLSFGEYGLIALGPYWFTDRQIEAARVAIMHHLKESGKLWLRIFPDKSVTAKPAETRMGKGKGDVSHWVAVVKPGRILFELAGISEGVAKEAFRLAGHKLPFKTKFIKR
ncbi:MAG: 50S ribosomal protein L16 [Candidatus Omnitrophica bacterium]|nr:50S ribosomal protein L16 [Candidatus Omnitrophota bacterium]